LGEKGRRGFFSNGEEIRPCLVGEGGVGNKRGLPKGRGEGQTSKVTLREKKKLEDKNQGGEVEGIPMV